VSGVELPHRPLGEVGVALDLIDGRHHRNGIQKRGEVLDHEVADPDGADPAFGEQGFEGAVRLVAVDLYGTAVILEEVGNVIAAGGAGVVIASQAGHRLGALTAEQDAVLATTPADELLAHPLLELDQMADSLVAYQLAKRGN